MRSWCMDSSRQDSSEPSVRELSDRADVTSVRAGTAALVMGALFVAATAFAALLSLSESFNPPDWVRVAGLVWLPIGFFGTPIAFLVSRGGRGRTRGSVGLALAFAALVGFVVLLVVAG